MISRVLIDAPQVFDFRSALLNKTLQFPRQCLEENPNLMMVKGNKLLSMLPADH